MTEHKGMKHKDAGIRKRVSEAVYPKDILADIALMSLSPVAWCAWVKTLLHMWMAGGYEIRKTYLELSRLWGMTVEEAQAAISEMIQVDVGKISVLDGVVCLISRRLERRHTEQAGNRKRQNDFRANGGGDPEKWTAIRVRILERDNHTCAYCGRKGLTVDHITPRSKGGGETWSNLVACCKPCNMYKNNRSLKDANMTFWQGFNRESLKDNTLVAPLKQVNNIGSSSSFSSSSSSSETPKSTSSSPPKPPSPDGDGSLPLAAEVYEKHPHLKTLHRVPMLRGITLEQWLMIRKNRSPFMDWPRAIAFVVSKAEIEGSIDKPGPFVDSRLGYYEKDHIRDIESAQTQAKKRARDVSDMANFIREMLADDSEQDPLARIERNTDSFISTWGRGFVADVEAILTPEIVARWKALKTGEKGNTQHSTLNIQHSTKTEPAVAEAMAGREVPA